MNKSVETKNKRICYLSLLAEVPAQASGTVYGIAGCICIYSYLPAADGRMQPGKCGSQPMLALRVAKSKGMAF